MDTRIDREVQYITLKRKEIKDYFLKTEEELLPIAKESFEDYNIIDIDCFLDLDVLIIVLAFDTEKERKRFYQNENKHYDDILCKNNEALIHIFLS